jgi:hypothetical protein
MFGKRLVGSGLQEYQKRSADIVRIIRRFLPQKLPFSLPLVFLLFIIVSPRAGAQPHLQCSLDVPTIIADNVNLKYVPMPFTVTLTVINTGNAATDTVFATIVAPPDLSLAGIDAPNKNTKKLLPSILQPNASSGLTWSVKHPITMTQKTYTILVWVKTSNADSSLCEGTVIIPAFDAPLLETQIIVPDSLHFGEKLGKYDPHPFEVRVTGINKGNSPVKNPWARIILPPELECAKTAEPLTKTFTTRMEVYKPGDPVPEVSWMVKLTDTVPQLKDRILSIQCMSGGSGFSGRILDTSQNESFLRIPGVPPRPHEQCIEGPDSIFVDSTCANYVNNPFTVGMKYMNDGWGPWTILNVSMASLESDGIQLAPDSPNALSTDLHVALRHNDSLVFRWKFKVDPRLSFRYVPLYAKLTGEDDFSLQCDRILPIPPMPFNILEAWPWSWQHVIDYDSSRAEMNPADWVMCASVENECISWRNHVEVELVIMDSSVNFIQVDPAYPENSNPRTIGSMPGYSIQYPAWHLKIDKTKLKCGNYNVGFTVRYSADGIAPQIWTRDHESVAVNIFSSATDVQPAITHAFSLDQNHPNPFSTKTAIHFQLPEAGLVRLSVFDVLGRALRTLVNERKPAGMHEAVFDASGVVPGMYFYRLETGSGVMTKAMMVVN